MLNENVRITPADSANCQLAWTAPAGDWASWVFVNGRHVRGPLVTGTADRVVKIPLAADAVVSLEIHDLPSTDIQVEPIASQPNTRPTIQWLAVADAVRYQVLHAQTSPQVVAVAAFTPTMRGMVAELDLPWDTTPPASPPDQFAVP